MMIENLIDRIKLPFRKEKELYSSIYAITGLYPRNISYYKQALLHRSLARRNANGRLVNNERLEFLGDAILDAIVGDIVYRRFTGKREGFLTVTRSKIVQRDTLNRLSQEIGISRLIMSNGHTSFHNSYMEGNAFEALVGAIYLDRGYSACMQFMEKRILDQLINLDKVAYKEVNFKSKLIEWCQKNKVRLHFREVECKRDDKNSPVFKYCAVIEGLEAGEATGYSKKESQQTASKVALQKLRRKPQFIDAVFAAKANRTKMEEEPVETVPDIEVKEDFLVKTPQQAPADRSENPKKRAAKPAAVTEKPLLEVEQTTATGAEIDFSDVDTSIRELSKEDIIAAAEAEAFSAAHSGDAPAADAKAAEQ